MTPTGFLRRVTVDAVGLLAALAVVSSWIGGPRAGLGVLAGGALTLGNLWWLSRRVVRITADPTAARWSSVVVVLRLAAVTCVVAVLLASGVAHPVGVVAGLTVLPCAMIARGLWSAREVSAPWR